MARNVFRRLLSLGRGREKNKLFSTCASPASAAKLSRDLAVNLNMIRDTLGNSMDVVVRELLVCRTRVALVYINGLINETALRENVMRALMIDMHNVEPSPGSGSKDLADSVKEKVLSIADVKKIGDFHTVLDGILGTGIVLFFNGEDTGLILKLPGFETRSVEEPHTETVVRGSREGFVEALSVNISMLRRRIKSPDLRLERMQVGGVTQTDICVAYIKGIVNTKLVDEVKKRLQRIDIDGVLESGYLEEFIEDAPFSIFQTVGNTERPDKVAAKLLEGRVAIFTDGTPIVLTVPYLYIESFQVSEDYYSRYIPGSLLRMIRLLCVIITAELPALYVAITAYNPEVLPSPLLISMASSREGVPFPAIGEILVMGVFFQILREAGVRLPRPVGLTVSLVGALVVGEAVVSAGLVSAPAVIIIALAGICSFVVPPQSDTNLLLSLFFTILAGFAGFFGLFLGFVLVLAHMASLRSFGAPYLSPAAPLSPGDLKDTFIRAPWWVMTGRPRVTGWKNTRRAGVVSSPSPPRNEEKKPAHRYKVDE